MIAKGDLPAFKLGGKVFKIRLADVEAFERQNGTISAVADSAPPAAAAERAEPVVEPAAEPLRAERRRAAPRIVMRKVLAPRPRR